MTAGEGPSAPARFLAVALLLILFIVVPIAELYVIIQVGQAIGVLPTLAILLADALLGSFLLRHQGRSAWRRFNAALDQRRFPGREVADGVMITVGGTLLLTPGFITDIFGLLLLVPPTRALLRRGLWLVLGRRFHLVSGPAGWSYERLAGSRRGPGPGRRPGPGRGPGPGPGPGPGSPRPGRPYDVEGTAHEVGDPGDPGPPQGESPRIPPSSS